MGVICNEKHGEKPILNNYTKGKKNNEPYHINERDINGSSAAPMVNTNNQTEYYIIAEFYVKDKNRNIRILNSYESFKRSCKDFKFEECKRNEKDIKECKIQIGKKIIPFSYFYSFNESGKFQIKFIFCKIPKSFACIFYDCNEITKIDFSYFNTQNITDMSYMFYNCSSLNNVDLSNFNTQNVTDMSYMFTYCIGLVGLDLSNFNSRKANVSEMLKDLHMDLSNIICYDSTILNTYTKNRI